MVFVNYDNRMKEYDYETALDIVDRMGLEQRKPLDEIKEWIELNIPLLFCQDKENLIELAEINDIKQSFLPNQTAEQKMEEVKKYHEKDYFNR